MSIQRKVQYRRIQEKFKESEEISNGTEISHETHQHKITMPTILQKHKPQFTKSSQNLEKGNSTN
jgi:hypothetical protein